VASRRQPERAPLTLRNWKRAQQVAPADVALIIATEIWPPKICAEDEAERAVGPPLTHAPNTIGRSGAAGAGPEQSASVSSCAADSTSSSLELDDDDGELKHGHGQRATRRPICARMGAADANGRISRRGERVLLCNDDDDCHEPVARPIDAIGGLREDFAQNFPLAATRFTVNGRPAPREALHLSARRRSQACRTQPNVLFVVLSRVRSRCARISCRCYLLSGAAPAKPPNWATSERLPYSGRRKSAPANCSRAICKRTADVDESEWASAGCAC
jgi:hypothetical protein